MATATPRQRTTAATTTASESAGIRLLIRTIAQLTGLHIDHYVQVNLLGFYRISNAIGGVDVCLNAAQNPNTDSDAFGKGYSGINLPAGHSVIKGSQALAFVRQRHGLPNGDLDRIKRQQYFLSAAFHKVVSGGVLLNPFKLRDLLKAVSSSMLTDPDLDMLALARQFQDLSAGNISYATIPNDGPQTIYPDGIETSIVGRRRGCHAWLHQPAARQARRPGAGHRPRREAVVGDAGRPQRHGHRRARRAQRRGAAQAGLPRRNDRFDHQTNTTTVEYPPGAQNQAKAVANRGARARS